MRKTLLVLLATAGLSAAVPALAQPQFAPPRQTQVSVQVDQAFRERAITRAQYQGFINELAAVQRLEQRYRQGGLTNAEVRDLNQRLDNIATRVQALRWAPDRRGNDLRVQIDNVDRTIRDAVARRQLDRQAADRLNRELAAVNAQFNEFRRSGDGFTRTEHDQLDRRIDQLADQVRNVIRDTRPTPGGGRGPDWNDNNPGRGPDWSNPGRGPDWNNPGRGPDWNNPGRGPDRNDDRGRDDGGRGRG